jgi:hypothetical protein
LALRDFFLAGRRAGNGLRLAGLVADLRTLLDLVFTGTAVQGTITQA